MKYYKCTVLVAVPTEDHKDWSDGGDEGFYLQDVVSDVGGCAKTVIYKNRPGVHLGGLERLTKEQFRELRNKNCWSEGGV